MSNNATADSRDNILGLFSITQFIRKSIFKEIWDVKNIFFCFFCYSTIVRVLLYENLETIVFNRENFSMLIVYFTRSQEVIANHSNVFYSNYFAGKLTTTLIEYYATGVFCRI